MSGIDFYSPVLVTDDLAIYDQNDMVDRLKKKKKLPTLLYNPTIFDFNPVIRQLI